MILEDFVMLGTTVPEPSSDGRIFVCSAGYSHDLRKLVRIYPLSRREIPHRWHQYRVPVERNTKDHRDESFKVRGDRSDGAHEFINRQFEEVGKVRPAELATALAKHTVSSVQEANERRISLAILNPTFHGLEFTENQNSPDSPQLALFDHIAPIPSAGAKRFPFNPRVQFTDDGGDHCLQLRDWGAYEWMRKYPDRYHEMNIRLDGRSTLLIGNMNNHRNTWLVISVLRGLRDDEQPAMFDLSGEAS